MDKLKSVISEFLQFVNYELLKKKYVWPCPRNIKFEADLDEKSKSIIYSAPEYPGLYTAFSQGENNEKITSLVNDAIFTYFDIPRYIAKKPPDGFQSSDHNTGKSITFALPQKFARA